MAVIATIRTSGNVITPGQNPISIKSIPVTQNYLTKLLDVDPSNLEDGFSLIYDEGEGKFVVAPVTIESSGLDGGTF